MKMSDAIRQMLASKPCDMHLAIAAMRAALLAVTDPPKSGTNGGAK
jgi:hypothetical protein